MNEPVSWKPASSEESAAELSWSELADALWLASHVELPAAPGAAPAPAAEPDVPPPADGPVPEPPGPQPEPPDDSMPDAPARGFAPEPAVGSDARDGARRGGPALSGKLAIARALQALARSGDSSDGRMLDEERTAIAAAETRLWLPRLTSGRDRQLELVVLADESGSMAFWTRTVHDFRILLERQGVFRNVRTVRLNTDHPTEDGYRTASGTTRHRIAELLDPTGRRVFLVVTDGIGPAWRDGTIRHRLGELARSGLLAVVNVLPNRLWRRTNLVTHPLILRAPAPAAPNHRLNYTAWSRSASAANGLPVPVLELDGRWLARWAKLTGAVEPVRLPALLLGAGPEDADDFDSLDFGYEPSARERVLRFRATASRQAFQLARLFAAAPLNLEVMQLIRHIFAPESEYAALMEVVLGGLLVRVDDETGGPHTVEFDFAPGVRGELLAAGERRATARVVRIVSDHFGPRMPVMLSARAVLEDPASTRLLDDEPHAEVMRSVMNALSGPYARRGRRSDRRGEASSHASARTSSDAGSIPARQPVIFGGVPERDSAFTSRGDALSVLADSLESESSTAVVIGGAGVGKSALVAEYVHRRRQDYDVVWWIRAGQAAEVVASFASLARRLGVADADDGARTAMAAAKAALDGRSRTLLVFDGAGSADSIRPLVPTRGHVIVTTRDPDWEAETRVLECVGFTSEERRAFVAELRPELPDAIDDRPAVLRHVVTFLRGSGITTAEYATRLAEKRSDVEDQPTVSAVWEVAFEHLNQHEEDAFRLAKACAFFAESAVPSSVLHAAETVLSLPDASEAARKLVSLGFARIDRAGGAVEFLPLVQAALRDWPESRKASRTAAHQLLVAAWHSSPEQRPPAADLVGHVRACGAVDSADRRTRELALDVAAALVATGDPVSATELVREIGEHWKARWGPDHPDTLAAALVLATSLHSAGDYESALTIDMDVAVRSARASGPDSPTTLAALRNQASDLAALGRLAEARSLHAETVATCSKIFGIDHPLSQSARRGERAGFADGR